MVCVGEIINTRGLKGEVKINSNFRFKSDIFKPNQVIFIGSKKDKVVIKNHRFYHNYDYLFFNDHDNINDVLIYKGENIYIDRLDLKKDAILSEDLIGYQVVASSKIIGVVEKFFNNNSHDVLVIKGEKSNHFLPHVEEFIKSVDHQKKLIDINEIEGLLNDN